jgi:predicted dehydrogenase
MEAFLVQIALIIPTVGRPDDLRACLQSIAREANACLAQVIVVDDGAAPPVIVSADLAGVPLHCLRNPERRGAAFSRNRALTVLADNVEAVGFIDDDARLCPGWLDVASRELTRDRGAITGPVRGFDSGIVSRARQLRYDRRYAPLAPGQPVEFLAGGNSLVWRDQIERANGFPDVPTMSDRLFLRQLEAQGCRCHFVPDMYVLHAHSKGLRIAAREAWRAGQLDDTGQRTRALARLARGVREALAGPEIAAGLLNVALDGVYLGSRAWMPQRREVIQAPGDAQRRDHVSAAPPSSAAAGHRGVMKRPSDAVRIAIIGCGRAAHQHVEAIRLAVGDGAVTGRVVAVVDDDETRAGELARQTGAAVRTRAQVLDDPQIDTVSICTPPDAHADLAVAALRAGKGVLIEKPVTRTTEELDAIIAAADAAALPAVAMLQHRGRLPATALEKAWTSGACASIEVMRPRESAYFQSEAWRYDPDRSGGGHMAHLAVHYLDLACQLLGTPATALGLADCRDVAAIDTRTALAVRFAGGALMTVLASAHPAPRSERLHVVDGDRELLVTGARTEYRDRVVEQLPPVPTPELRALVYRELWAAVRGETPPDRYSVARARGVTVVLESVRRLTAAEAAL